MASVASRGAGSSAPVTVSWRLPAAIFVAVLAFRAGPAAGTYFAYLLLAVFALTSRAAVIQALALSWLITMMSPGLASASDFTTIGRYLVVGTAAASVFIRVVTGTGFLLRPFTALTIGLGLFLAGHAIFFSALPDVSILKALIWTLTVTTLYAAWMGLDAADRVMVGKWLFYGLVAIMAISLPLIVLPVGYLRNGTGFQGVLNHPQAFGSTMSLLGAWAGAKALALRKPAWPLLTVAALSLVMIVLSETRTAGVGMVFGVGIAALVAPLLAGRKVTAMLPGLKSKRFQLVALLALGGSVAFGGALSDMVEDFISKSGRAQSVSLLEAYDQSRGGMIEEMTENIAEQPWAGIGFGIASNPNSMSITYDPFFGLPVSASIEKGVAPLAMLEETGVLGFGLFLAWVWVLLRRSARAGFAPLAVLSTVLLVNLGESVLFSPGGMGMLHLILVTWAVSAVGERQTIMTHGGYPHAGLPSAATQSA